MQGYARVNMICMQLFLGRTFAWRFVGLNGMAVMVRPCRAHQWLFFGCLFVTIEPFLTEIFKALCG